MKKLIWLLMSILLGLVIFVIAALSVNLGDVLKSLGSIAAYEFLILLIFYAIIMFISVARWNMVARAFGYDILFTKFLSIRLAEWASSYVTPFSRLGGEPLMAYLLKKEAKVKYRKGISIIIINKIMDWASALILVLIGLILLIVNYWDVVTGKMLTALISTIIVLIFLIYMFYIKTIKKQGFFTMILRPFKGIITHKSLHDNIKIVEHQLAIFLKEHKKRIFVLFIVSLIIQVLTLLEYKLISLFLGFNLSIVHILIINIFLVLSFIVPTPGSIGGMEGMLVFVFGLIGLSKSNGFAFSLGLRSLEICITAIGLIIAYYYGVKSIKKVVDEKV